MVQNLNESSEEERFSPFLVPHQNRLVKGDMRNEFSTEIEEFRLLAGKRVLCSTLVEGQ